MSVFNVTVSHGKERIWCNGIEGQKYEVTIYPIPPNHARIVSLITNIIKDALE